MIRTADAYRAGLSDGRRVFYRGEAVKDVVADPELRVAVDHPATAFDLAHDPDVRHLGAATLVAQANGIAGAGHVRDKLTQLIAYAETVRGLTHLAASRADLDERGMARPDPLTVNMAKYTFAHGFHGAVAKLVDLAGGLLVTAPGGEDWDSPEIRPVLEKYFAAAVPAEERLRLIHLISDLTARDFGGYQAVLATHAEGSLEAEKLQLLRSYDAGPVSAYARRLAHV